jgi:hypothetical protein
LPNESAAAAGPKANNPRQCEQHPATAFGGIAAPQPAQDWSGSLMVFDYRTE